MAISGTIALIFDFDDTLVSDSTTALLRKYGIDPDIFWKKDLRALINDGFDPALGFLKLLLDNIGPDRPFGRLTNEDLRAFGATLDSAFKPGLPELFSDLRSIVGEFRIISIEFYIISGGLQAIIEGSQIVKDNFSAVYGCTLDEEGILPLFRASSGQSISQKKLDIYSR